MARSVPATADVVVVGAGAIGTSVAYHLAAREIRVVVVERDTIASGSTGKAAGGIRTQFGDDLNVRIMRRSLDAFERFEDDVGASIGFRACGYVFLVDSEPMLEAFRAALAIQQRLGVPAREVPPDRIGDLVPGCVADDLLGAFHCSRDGRALPEAVAQGYARGAADRGATFVQGCSVEGIDVADARVTSVQTSSGAIATEVVVCAAGVGSSRVGAMVGVDLPVEPERHWLFWAPPGQHRAPDLPFTIDFGTGFHVQADGAGMIFGGRGGDLAEIAEAATRRIPAMSATSVGGGWWGDYDVSPDRNGLIGAAAELSGFYYATGFSGHGFMQAPAVGEHIAERICGVNPTLDLTALDLTRLARNASRPEAIVF